MVKNVLLTRRNTWDLFWYGITISFHFIFSSLAVRRIRSYKLQESLCESLVDTSMSLTFHRRALARATLPTQSQIFAYILWDIWTETRLVILFQEPSVWYAVKSSTRHQDSNRTLYQSLSVIRRPRTLFACYQNSWLFAICDKPPRFWWQRIKPESCSKAKRTF